MQELNKTHSARFLNMLEQLINLPYNKEIVLRTIEEVVENFPKNREEGSPQSLFNEWTEKLSMKLDDLKENLPFRDKRIRKAIEMLEEKFHEPIKVGDIADEVGLSEAALMRLFQKTTNKTMIEYLTEIRMKHAKRMLRETTDTVEGIAYSCGYTSNRYFSMAFRRCEGITPGEFRKKA
jgi:transcriptional regulator GlxA family with amidase domain